jgi:hypothetical protein
VKSERLGEGGWSSGGLVMAMMVLMVLMVLMLESS